MCCVHQRGTAALAISVCSFWLGMSSSSHSIGLRQRVLRLMNGELRVNDLTTLFLNARRRTQGRETIEEIGDFVAHQDTRTRG